MLGWQGQRALRGRRRNNERRRTVVARSATGAGASGRMVARTAGRVVARTATGARAAGRVVTGADRRVVTGPADQGRRRRDEGRREHGTVEQRRDGQGEGNGRRRDGGREPPITGDLGVRLTGARDRVGRGEVRAVLRPCASRRSTKAARRTVVRRRTLWLRARGDAGEMRGSRSARAEAGARTAVTRTAVRAAGAACWWR